MEYLIGVILALAVVGFAAATGLDRGRVFYPTVAMVNASYYVLFAVMGASSRTLGMEIAVASGFSFLAVLGFKRNFWLVAVAIAGHGVFDFVHHLLIENPGMPHWWPGFCLAFDGTMGAWLALRLVTRSPHPNEPDRPSH
jgi:hypothetical protein